MKLWSASFSTNEKPRQSQVVRTPVVSISYYGVGFSIVIWKALHENLPVKEFSLQVTHKREAESVSTKHAFLCEQHEEKNQT